MGAKCGYGKYTFPDGESYLGKWTVLPWNKEDNLPRLPPKKVILKGYGEIKMRQEGIVHEDEEDS